MRQFADLTARHYFDQSLSDAQQLMNNLLSFFPINWGIVHCNCKCRDVYPIHIVLPINPISSSCMMICKLLLWKIHHRIITSLEEDFGDWGNHVLFSNNHFEKKFLENNRTNILVPSRFISSVLWWQNLDCNQYLLWRTI